ncbi:hypothetical protein BDR05DRAFT_1006636 [Suillus weaverae]|nr:hypothetical protein BDR05DRAFT_1006636 [Suillus weaverae]
MQDSDRERERAHYSGRLPIDLPGIRKVFVYDPRRPPEERRGQLFQTGVIKATGDITVTAPLPSQRDLPPMRTTPLPIAASPVAATSSHPYARQRSTNEKLKRLMQAAKSNMRHKVLLENTMPETRVNAAMAEAALSAASQDFMSGIAITQIPRYETCLKTLTTATNNPCSRFRVPSSSNSLTCLFGSQAHRRTTTTNNSGSRVRVRCWIPGTSNDQAWGGTTSSRGIPPFSKTTSSPYSQPHFHSYHQNSSLARLSDSVFVYDPRRPPEERQGQLFQMGVIKATGDITVTAPLPSQRDLPPMRTTPLPIAASPVAATSSHPYARQRSTNEELKRLMQAAKSNMRHKVLLENAMPETRVNAAMAEAALSAASQDFMSGIAITQIPRYETCLKTLCTLTTTIRAAFKTRARREVPTHYDLNRPSDANAEVTHRQQRVPTLVENHAYLTRDMNRARCPQSITLAYSL